jgi:hypothetical protein
MRESGDNKTCVEISATAQALFLSSFEKWVEAGMKCSEHGESPEQRAQVIRNSYRNAVQANIDYHKGMVARSKESGEYEIASLHYSLMQGYEALLF